MVRPKEFGAGSAKTRSSIGWRIALCDAATGPDQVAFMKKAGMPLTTPGLINYTDVAALKRIR